MKHLIIWTLAVVSLLCGCTKDRSTKLKNVDDVCKMMDDITFMEYCYDNFDVNHDGMVSMTEATAVKRIDLYNSKYIESIYSLKGIEYFTQLTYLSCGWNYLSSLDVSKNTQLTYLSCSGNNLSALDISDLPELERSNSNLYYWGEQANGIVLTITDKKEYWDKLPSEYDSERYRIQWIWK